MSITRDFKLSLVAGRSVPLVINANQYDDGEIWRFTLLDETGQKYSPSTGSIIGLKSDGHIIANAGTVSSTGLVIIPETEQMTAAVGKNFYELLIDDDTHGTANFIVFVEPRPGAGGTPSDSDLAVFQEAIDAAATIGDVVDLVDDVAVLEARMDEFTTLTDGSTTGDAELADIRVGADGTTYPNAGDAVRGQYSDLKDTITKYNSYDILKDVGTFKNGTSGGVTYTWNADKTACTAVGTTTTISVKNLYNDQTLPSGMVNGETYIIKVSTTNPNLLLEINAYNGSTSILDLLITENIIYTVPAEATRLLIRLRTRHTSSSSSTVNDTISVQILNAKTNKELESELEEKTSAINYKLGLPVRQYMQIFPKYTTIGDSLMGGFMNRDGVSVNTVTARDAGNNWVNYIALRTGRAFTNLAVGGSTAKQWRESLLTSANIDTDCYLIGIGVNDHRNSLTIGSSADIATDFNNNADSFYGNYDFLIRQLMAWKPYAHIFCFTIPEIEGGTSANYNTAIKAICDLYPNKVHCINLAENYADYYDVDIVNNNYTGRHFNPVAYNYMSLIIEKAINEYIEANNGLFATAPYQ